jgi:hypothetical protein
MENQEDNKLDPEYERGFIDGMKTQAQRQANSNDAYVAGWNAAIEVATTQVAMFLRSMRK